MSRKFCNFFADLARESKSVDRGCLYPAPQDRHCEGGRKPDRGNLVAMTEVLSRQEQTLVLGPAGIH